MILIILSALFLYLSFPNYFFPFGCWPFAWFFAIPLFFALQNKTLLTRLVLGVLFGIIFYPLLVHWFIPYSLAGYVLFAAVLIIQPVFFSFLYRSHQKAASDFTPPCGGMKETHLFNREIGYANFAISCRRKLVGKMLSIFPCMNTTRPRPRGVHNRICDVFYPPALWVVSEYLRTSLLNGFSWNLGHSQSFSVYVIQIANLVGSYGVSFVVILVNYCLYRMIRRRNEWKFYGTIILLTLTMVFGYGYLSIHTDAARKASADSLKICTIQPNIDFKEKGDYENVYPLVAQHAVLTEEILKHHHPDLIVWPETAIPADFRQDQRIKDKIKDLAARSKSSLLLGAALFQGERDYNSAVLFDEKGESVNFYNKQVLVPFSEYLPSGRWALVLKGILKIKTYNFTAGPGPGMFTLPLLSKQIDTRSSERSETEGETGKRFGVLICSEDTLGHLFKEYVRSKAGFLIVLLNDGWFSQDAALIMHTQNAIMHTTEYRMPVVRASNTGWSCSIDKFGRILPGRKENPSSLFRTKTFFVHKVTPNQEQTFYYLFGDTFCALCMGFVIINFVKYRVLRTGYNTVK